MVLAKLTAIHYGGGGEGGGKELTSANLAEIKTEICKSTVCLTFIFNSKHLVFSVFHLTALSGTG